MDASEFIRVGEIVKAVGLRGEIKLYPYLDFHEPLLQSGYAIWDDGTPVKVQRHRPAGETVVLKIAGVDHRDQAESQVGRGLGFRRESYLAEDFPKPEQGLPFRYLDRTVETVGGQTIGTVEEVRRAGTALMLIVMRDGRELLIPAVEPILIPDFGLEGPLVIDPPEGLFDVQLG